MDSISKPRTGLGQIAKRIQLTADALKFLPEDEARLREEAKNLTKELKAIAAKLRAD